MAIETLIWGDLDRVSWSITITAWCGINNHLKKLQIRNEAWRWIISPTRLGTTIEILIGIIIIWVFIILVPTTVNIRFASFSFFTNFRHLWEFIAKSSFINRENNRRTFWISNREPIGSILTSTICVIRLYFVRDNRMIWLFITIFGKNTVNLNLPYFSLILYLGTTVWFGISLREYQLW